MANGSCDFKPEEPQSNLIKLKELTESLKFSTIMGNPSDVHWVNIKVAQGAAFIRTLIKVDDIAVSDNYSSPGTHFPSHAHPAREVFIVYEGEMELNLQGEIHRIKQGDPAFEFFADKEHSAVFPVESRYIAITIPADDDWPEE